jgi:ABC-type uncharacterized transport system ATPase subunit
VSSELTEIVDLSDRVYVLHAGAIGGELSREEPERGRNEGRPVPSPAPSRSQRP